MRDLYDFSNSKGNLYVNKRKDCPETEEKKVQFRQSAFDAWDEYQLSGVHVTNSEVERWLQTWGDSESLPSKIKKGGERE